MAQISTLPTVHIEIAFSPSNVYSTTQTWTDVSSHYRSFSTRGGRQHYLDRIEASALNIVFDDRDGWINTSAWRPRLPIRVYVTWFGNNYYLFQGTIESIQPRWQDQLNVDMVVTAIDNTKLLSLRYLYNTALFPSMMGSSVRSYYAEPKASFLEDTIGVYDGSVSGHYSLTFGAALYDTKKSIDVTAGTDNTNFSNIRIPVGVSNPSTYIMDYGFEFWVIGQELAGFTLLPLNVIDTSAFTYDIGIKVDLAGRVVLNDGTTAQKAINDGYWHHIAVISSGTNVQLIVDGVVTTSPTVGGVLYANNSTYYNLADTALCYVDNIVVSKTGVTTTDVINRYIAGSLLRNDVLPADRIAEALVIANVGSISAGAINIPSYKVDGSSYVYKNSKNGCFYTQGYLDSVTNQTALDVILSASDTEIAIFYQDGDGTFSFHTRSYQYINTRATTAQYGLADTVGVHYETNIDIIYDDADTWTSVIVQPQNGESQTYENVANESLYGASTLTKSGTLQTTNDAAYQTAVYLGYIFQSPLKRAQNIEVRSTTNNGGTNLNMLTTDLQDRVNVIRTNTAASFVDTDMVVESLQYDFESEPGLMRTSLVLDPYPIRNTTQDTKPIMILNNSTYGLLDGTNYLL